MPLGRVSLGVGLMIGLAVLGCGSGIFDSQTTETEGLHIQLLVDPVEIERGGKFEATLSLRNLQAKERELVSGCTALAWIQAFHKGKVVSLYGTVNGCYDVLTTFRIPANGVWEQVLEITAMQPGVPPSSPPKGEYVLQTDFMTLNEEGRVIELPKVEARFVLR